MLKCIQTFATAALGATVALTANIAIADEPVTVDNFVRAESDFNLRANLANLKTLGGDIGQIVHGRDPATVETQTVIRTNQDTLYSLVVVDLSEPIGLLPVSWTLS